MKRGPFAPGGLCCPADRHYYGPLRLPLDCPTHFPGSAYPVGSGDVIVERDLAVGRGVMLRAESEERLKGGHWRAARL